MTIGKRLYEARQSAGLTQRQLAEKSGQSQQMISKLESGQSKETAGIVAFALACGVRPEWLFNGSGSMRKEAARGPPLAEAAVGDTQKSGPALSQIPLASTAKRGALPPLAEPDLDPNVLALARAIESLSPDARGHLQAVTDSFVKSAAAWDGVERRKTSSRGNKQ